jgi:hypothetical protein
MAGKHGVGADGKNTKPCTFLEWTACAFVIVLATTDLSSRAGQCQVGVVHFGRQLPEF